MRQITYEFPYVSSKQKMQLILCKAFVIILMLMFLTMLVVLDDQEYGQNLLYVSGVMNACFAYFNLMTVRVEVQELFEPPVQFKAYELFWLGVFFFVVSFFI